MDEIWNEVIAAFTEMTDLETGVFSAAVATILLFIFTW
jgi:hypothetical protein